MIVGRAGRWAIVVVYAAVIFGLSAQEDLALPMPTLLSDKVYHAIEYAGFAAILAVALRAGGSRFILVRAALLAILYGLADEYHQQFVPGRQADVADVAADAVGAVVACLLLFLVHWRRRVDPAD
jgi:VanZ family protein